MNRTYLQVLPAAAAPLLIGTLSVLLGSARGPKASPVSAKLSEWKIELSTASVAQGPVTFLVSNVGSIPHALEVEGQGLEQRTNLIQPGATATLTVSLRPGNYEVYCPVGDDSHKKLGMVTHLSVTGAPSSAKGGFARNVDFKSARSDSTGTQSIQVSGGGPVIQILPGPFPFPDSLTPVLPAFGEERPTLEAQARNGPYSNNVATISGRFTVLARDRGATGDSVSGIAEFSTQDAARWRLVLDRVQTKDVPHHPRFGGVIMGLYYHGNTTVHTPLVPTIKSAMALWAVGHLYRNGVLVTDSAMVHVMLLSRTRRTTDFALACWDCSKNPVDELQLQVTPAPGEPKFDAPGGVLFVNWEKSGGHRLGG